jgi:SpoIID/LytB domain protein
MRAWRPWLLLACLGVALGALAEAPPKAPAPKPSAASDELELPPAPEESATKRLDFRQGAPVVPVKLMEGHTEVTFSSKGRLKLLLAGPAEKTVEGPAGTVWRARLKSGTPADVVARIQLVEVPFADKAGLAQAEAEWSAKGLAVRSQVLGQVYGIAGKVVDNRRYVVLVDAPPRPPLELAARQAEILTRYSVRTQLLEEVRARGHVTIELLDAEGSVLGTAVDRLTAEPLDKAPIEVRRVEYGVGYDFHNFEDRAYRGALQVTADTRGKLAIINQVAMEDLLKGLVPSEIFAKAPPEALKAQAVTARGEVLAKVGLKHLADPYLLCTEQHCAVYKGVSGEASTTSAAIEATAGEALFDANGRLVDSVYSAVCGGHTENNEIVWGGVANPSLRGRPDVLPGKTAPASPDALATFLSTEGPYACRLSTFAQPAKFRWEKRFTAREIDEKLASFNLGTVYAMSVTERGVSGRARLLSISGETGATTVRGELTIRRLFSNLNSAMFEVKAERDAKGRPTAWVFTGGGWGHGVGMCQTGAIGRAEAGQNYRQILEHYFNGAQVARLY